jgi:endo-1,4-beta-D-glucanase Y/4-amino-4-deoxy-L-arabinose transferase-like glycosyltransferase
MFNKLNLKFKLSNIKNILVNQIKNYDFLVFVLALIIVIMTHTYNMFQLPYYEDDEGIYQAQAWAVSNLNELAPYTYWYDHAPAGWIVLSLLTRLSGGFYMYNISGLAALDTGRIIIALIKFVMVVLTYFIIKELTKKPYLAAIGMIVMSVSPVALYYQRRILLDNIMILFIMLSLYILIRSKVKITGIVVSALLLGIAVLTKESAVFYVPGFVLLAVWVLNYGQKKLGFLLYSAFLVIVVALYPLLAILKTEFLPSNSKVSLIGTLQQQAARGTKLPFWDVRSDFIYNLNIWFGKDPYFILASALTMFISIYVAYRARNKYLASIQVMIWGMMFFLMRGGIVLDFYIVPLIPLITISMMSCLGYYIDKGTFVKLKLNKEYVIFATVVVILALTIFNLNSNYGRQIMSKKENITLANSLQYIKDNIPNNSNMLISFSHWLDLRNKDNGSKDVFPNAEYFYKADFDNNIKYKKFKNDWKNIDYTVASHQIYKSSSEGITPFVKTVLDNSFLIADFQPIDDYNTLPDSKYYTVNGNWSSVFRTNNDPNLLKRLNKKYNDTFVTTNGRVVDDQSNLTTSEGQSYSLLRSIITQDRDQFDKVWEWTKINLQVHPTDSLFAWKYGLKNSQLAVLDKESATDADLDIAYSLLLANKTFKDDKYLDEAKKIISDIWKQRVREYNGRSYLLPFSSTADRGFEILNPSYFSPSHYRMFATVDGNNWSKLVDDTYLTLNDLSSFHSMYPDWIKYNFKSNRYEPATEFLQNQFANNFSYDGMRVLLRTGMDYQASNDPRAYKLLEKASKFIESKLDQGLFPASIDQQGNKVVDYEAASMNAMISIPLRATNSTYQNRVWKDKILNATDYKEATFGKNKTYYDQNLVWFSYAYGFDSFKLPK